jgi:hypothetical protein
MYHTKAFALAQTYGRVIFFLQDAMFSKPAQEEPFTGDSFLTSSERVIYFLLPCNCISVILLNKGIIFCFSCPTLNCNSLKVIS